MTAALLIAVISMLTNITTTAQLEGDANTLLATRLTLSKLANTGTVWAGLLILAGWLVKRPAQAAVAGILSGLLSLAAHYALGRAAGIYTAQIWDANLNWFLMTAVVGAPLGLIGAAAHRADDLGFLARLSVPLGAILEPWVRGMFTHSDITPWPGQVSSIVCGALLIVGGLSAAVMAVRSIRPRAGLQPSVSALG